MANEITLSASLVVRNGLLRLDWRPPQQQIAQSAARGGNPGTVNIGTSEEVLAFGDLSTLGYVGMQNLDDTNYVEIGPEVAGALAKAWKLKPGEHCVLRLCPGITYRAQANTAAVNVLIFAVND